MNSEAQEFEKLLGPRETWADRPVIVARLFINKHQELIRDIVDRGILGPVAAWFAAVEFQKRLHY